MYLNDNNNNNNNNNNKMKYIQKKGRWEKNGVEREREREREVERIFFKIFSYLCFFLRSMKIGP